MEASLLALRLLLAVVFGVAGAAKFADLAGSRRSLADFGVPEPLTRPFSIILPAVEIAVAAALLFVSFSWFGAIGAVGLLGAFLAGMIAQMIKGKAPDCHCFGQLHSEPVGAKSLIRNIVFMIPAVILFLYGRGNQGLSISSMNPELIQLFAIVLGVVLLGAMLFYLHKISGQQTDIMRRIELIELISRDGSTVERDEAGSPHDGLPIGAALPDFELNDLDGRIVSTGSLKVLNRPSLLLFVSPTCNPCKAMLPMFDEWAAELGDRMSIIFVSSGTAAENAEKFATDSEKTILLQNDREFADSVNARWTPSALFVSGDGRVASHVAAGDSAIGELVEKIKATDLTQEFSYFELGSSNGSHSHVKIGESVPDFNVEALDGKKITAGGLKGKRTLVTFWSPTCPHCLNMIEQIKDWDSAKGMDEPDLLIFSDGDEEPHRELGLKSPIVLDKQYKLSEKLGMHGTPSAILVNEDGRFASELAVGAANIWALIGKRKPDSK